MFPTLLVCAALAPGQPPAAEPAAPEPAATADAPAGPSTRLMKSLQGTDLGDFLTDRKTTVSGFVDLRYSATNVGSLNRLPAGMGLSYNPDLPQFNWVMIDRPVDKTANAATWGYRVDTRLYDSTYQFTMARGLFTGQLTNTGGAPNPYGVDVIQHYVEGYFPNVLKGFDVQFGRRYARFGVESVNPTLNPLPTLSYAFTYTPFTQSGLFTEVKLTDDLTLTNDFTCGSDNYFFDPTNKFTWLGAVKYDFTKTTSLRGAALLGKGTFDVAHAFHNPDLVDVVFTHKFGCDAKWAYTFEYLYGWTYDVPGIGFADWSSYVNYLSYAWTDKFSTTGRIEFFDDKAGQRTGFRGLYTGLTVGNTWKPADYLLLRPEVRYDYNNTSRPFDGQPNLFTVTLNAIVLW